MHVPEEVGMASTEIEAILKKAWDIAIQRNPMLMVRLRPDYDYTKLRDMIKDCLSKGLSVEETCEHTVGELFKTAMSYSQPSDDCNSEQLPEPVY